MGHTQETFTNHTLQKIEGYSANELNEFTKFSPIARTYLRLLEQKNIPSIYSVRHNAWIMSALASFFDNAPNRTIFSHWSQAMDDILMALQKDTGLDQEPLDLLALGKYGSQVLNLSSDIDVLFIADDLNGPLLAKTRRFIKLINQKTEWGFLSRVDLNLKPQPLKDRFIIPPQGLIDYLWNSTELWERLIYTRSRSIFKNTTSDTDADYLSHIKKFCFRKYVNMNLIEDLSGLLNKILQHNHDPNNIKLRPGGIRSLELFFNSLQLLYGGRDEDLHTPNTYLLLDHLANKNYIKHDELQILQKNYDFLRRVENLIQIYTDSQEHSVSTHIPIAAQDINNACKENTEILIGYMNQIIGNRKKTVSHISIIDEEMDVEKFPHLENLKQFLQKKPQYKDLILSHPKTFTNLLQSLKYSPYLSRILLLRPDLFDLFLIQKTIINESADDETLLTQLVDFRLLNYITALGDFLIHFNVDTLTSTLSLTADRCIGTILNKVFPDTDKIKILRLGKWSGQEVGLKSDLDFIFVCEDENIDLKKVRKVIHYIGHHTFYGPFYNIDLRLRPSGNAGPIVTNSTKLGAYISDPGTSAWIKQSYLRNSFLNNAQKFNFNSQHFGLTSVQKEELLDIRSKRLLPLHANKISPKETQGGLIDLEFFIQHLCLDKGHYPQGNAFNDIVQELTTAGHLSSDTSQQLVQIYRQLRTTEQICALKSATTDLAVTEYNAPMIFDLPSGSESILPTPLTYDSLHETLRQAHKLIEAHHPFLL
ncbi:MAG: hypothetical protein M9899_01765 [Bdellovibrionaceae bacterium]|nr:hypothetical protein [Pseudobdellovibrionaceae bacterium]